MKAPLFLLTFFLIILLRGSVDSDQRIYGGYKIDVTQAPYMVAIVILVERNPNGTNKVHECGGSILRPNLILTAAHCNVDTKNDRKPFESDRFQVISGTNKVDPNGGPIHLVKTVFVHPKYLNPSGENRFHDVGLLELNDDITLSSRSQLVNLAHPNDRPAVGTDCAITGYGTNPDHPDDQQSLYQVHLKVITSEQCVDELAQGTVQEVETHNICVKAPNKNQCRGDSGGPLHDVNTKRQVGIVSYGDEDCTTDTPSIDTRVTDNLDFIEKVIRQTTRRETDVATIAPTNTQTNPMSPGILNMLKPIWQRT